MVGAGNIDCAAEINIITENECAGQSTHQVSTLLAVESELGETCNITAVSGEVG